MISQESIQKMLGIKGQVILSPDEMARDLKITFFPKIGKNIDSEVVSFSNEIKKAFSSLGVEILNYEDCLEFVYLHKRLKRVFFVAINNFKYLFFPNKKELFYIPFSALKRVIKNKRLKKGISVIALGDLDSDLLPMQFITSFKNNSIINIVKFPVEEYEHSGFSKHYDNAMSLFSYHMANIIIGVSAKKWILYNFNASHPIFSRLDDFEKNILQALIPKIYAPISPNLLSEFKILKEKFDPIDKVNISVVEDMKDLAKAFAKTRLFPDGKKINDLPFRDNFHKFIGKIHLDNRNGMSFGFISKQMPMVLSKIHNVNDDPNLNVAYNNNFFYDKDGKLNFVFDLNVKDKKGRFFMKVPDVWMMTLRSGSNKTDFNIDKDLLKIGLINGEMYMQFPKNVRFKGDYRPSFDTKVILAQAVGNGIIASIIKFIKNDVKFVDIVEKKGMSVVHWHGYINPKIQTLGLYSYGEKNPHVACSSPQSAIYSLEGKLDSFFKNIESVDSLLGHIHVEPHHGINVSHIDIISLINDIINKTNYTSLGNKYLII